MFWGVFIWPLAAVLDARVRHLHGVRACLRADVDRVHNAGEGGDSDALFDADLLFRR